MREIKEIIARVGGHRNRECYAILSYAVEAAWSYQPQEPKMETIEADVVQMLEHRKGVAAVSRALSRAAADIWEYGDRRALKQIWGGPLREQPTPKELVFRMAEYLWNHGPVRSRPREVRYRRWKSLMGTGYGVTACLRDPLFRVVTCPVCKDVKTADRLVRQLNERQMPLSEFEELYLTGRLLEWLEEA